MTTKSNPLAVMDHAESAMRDCPESEREQYREARDAVAELVEAAKAVEYWMQMHPNRASTAPLQPFRAALARFEVQP